MALTGSNLHINVPLSNYVIAWKPPANKATWFARGDFFPQVPVDKDSDLIRQVSQGRMLQLYEAAVGEDGLAGSAPTVDFAMKGNLTFKCRHAALKGMINYYKAKQADGGIQYEKRQTDAPRWALEMWAENQALPVLLNSNNYGNNVTSLNPNAYWDNYGSSSSTVYDDDIANGLEKIVMITGSKANRLGMSLPLWRIIKGHPGLTRRPFSNQGGQSPQMLTTEIFEGLFKEWLEPGSLRIYGGYYDRAGAPNDDGANGLDGALFWGPGMVAAYVEQNTSLDDFSFAKSFCFAGLGDDAPGASMAVLERDAPEVMPIGGREIRVVTSMDWKITNAVAGWIWPTVLDKTSAQFNNPAGSSWFS